MDDVVVQVNFVNQFELTLAITNADVSEGEIHIFRPPLGKAERIAEFYNSMTEEERSLYRQYLKCIYLGKQIGDVNLYLYRLNEFYQANNKTSKIESWG